MKLNSCYIEGFGAIKKQTIKFNENITAVCEENGYGKTTLAAFLEAMFYGMDSSRSNEKELSARKHYLPFDGGKYGGNVTFEYGGDTYKIERGFDESSEPKDKLTVYKNGNVYDFFGKNIGQKLFGIDYETFRRLIVITSDEIEIKSTGSINSKLGTVFMSGGDANTEKALKTLDGKAALYRKKRGGGGLIPQENDAVFSLQKQIGELQEIKKALPEKYKKLHDRGDELKALQRKLEDAQSGELALKDWEHYDALVKAAENCKQKIEEIDGKYPYGLPSDEEIKAARGAISAKAALEKQTENLLSPQDGAELERLEAVYRGGPAESDIAAASRKISEISETDAELRALENGAPSERENALNAKFSGSVPQKSVLDAADAALDEYKRREKIYAETPDYITEQTAARKSGGKKYLVSAIISAAIAAAGIGVIFAMLVAGVIILAAGLIGLAASGFLYLNNKTGAAETVQKPNPEKAAADRAKNNADLKIRQLLSPYGYTDESSVYYLVESFKNDAAEYGAILQNKQKTGGRIADLRARRQNLQNELRAFFAPYKLTGESFGKQLAELQSGLGRYNSLKETRDRLLAQNESTINAIRKHDGAIQNFRGKYAPEALNLSGRIAEIEDDVAARRNAAENLRENLKKAELFKTEKGLERRPESTDRDIRQTNAEIERLNAERSALLVEIDADETSVEKIDALTAEKQNREQTLETYKKNYANLCRAMELLKKADTRLNDRYIKPIKDNFLKYAVLLEETLGEKVTMTSDFEIRFERGGEDRSEKYLSTGQLSICAFCFRIALVDNMYSGEKPFLILDDPFVNLDEKHLVKVKQLLKELSGDVQIIYFTCHESRNV